jgi:hypothetical protein
MGIGATVRRRPTKFTAPRPCVAIVYAARTRPRRDRVAVVMHDRKTISKSSGRGRGSERLNAGRSEDAIDCIRPCLIYRTCGRRECHNSGERSRPAASPPLLARLIGPVHLYPPPAAKGCVYTAHQWPSLLVRVGVYTKSPHHSSRTAGVMCIARPTPDVNTGAGGSSSTPRSGRADGNGSLAANVGQ